MLAQECVNRLAHEFELPFFKAQLLLELDDLTPFHWLSCGLKRAWCSRLCLGVRESRGGEGVALSTESSALGSLPALRPLETPSTQLLYS